METSANPAEGKSMEEQIAAKHLEVFGIETPERMAHVAQVIARLRAQGARSTSPTAWKRPTDEEQPPTGHQGDE